MGGGTWTVGSGPLPLPGACEGISDEPGTGVGVGRNVCGPPLGSTTGPDVGAGWQPVNGRAKALPSTTAAMSGWIGMNRRGVARRIGRECRTRPAGIAGGPRVDQPADAERPLVLS